MWFFKFKEYKFKSFSFLLLLDVYVIGAIGIYLISILQDADENLYQKQIIAYVAGFGLLMVVAMVDYHFIGKCFWLLFLISLGLLLICRFSNSAPVYGWAHYSARRWIKIGGSPTDVPNTAFEFMPSEITKVAMIIFNAKLFELCRKYINKFWVLVLSLVFMIVPVFLILTQTDLSTSIVLMLVYCAMVFASGVPYKFILPIVGFLIPTGIGLFWYVQQDFQVLLKDYQQRRVFAMLHPEEYPELAYQQSNARTAIESGGTFGKIITGDASLSGTRYVPVKESDFIFSAVGEGFGFVGSIVVLVLYLIMFILIIRIARRAKDYLGFMIALGIGALFTFQVFINIAVVTSLIPNTGIALPFMSSGLSSLLINLLMIGILLNISMQPREKEERTVSEFEFPD